MTKLNVEAGRSDVIRPVLVVDDDALMRETICWALSDEGLTVETAGDGQQAINQADRLNPSVVVLDMTLPDVSGEEVASRLRARQREMPLLLLITADGRAAEKARRVGAYAYLHKPFELDHLVNTVRAGLEAT